MARLILYLCIYSLILGSCGIPPTNMDSEPKPSLKPYTETVNPTDTLVPSGTPHRPTVSLTNTPGVLMTEQTEPKVAQSPPERYDLPALITNQPITITQINMMDVSSGWAIGHQSDSGDRILYTQNGGLTWEERTPPVAYSPEPDASQFQAWANFYDGQISWVIYLPQNQPPPTSSPIVWRTLDGGSTWQDSEPLPLTGGEAFFLPEQFSFSDPNRGWLLVHIDAGMSHDYSNLYTTIDGGNTWQKLIDPYSEGLQSVHNTGMAFMDSNLGWVTKDNLAVIPGAFLEQSLDGGHTWENIFLPPPEEIDWVNEIIRCETSNPIYLKAARGIVLVNCLTFEGSTYTYIYQTSNKGQSWQSTPLPSSVQSLYFINNEVGWAFGRDLYQSSDGGLSWVKIKTVNWDGQFNFVDPTTGWAVASANGSIALVFTQNGGNTWQILEPTLE